MNQDRKVQHEMTSCMVVRDYETQTYDF